MNYGIQDYVNYFENIARSLNSIAHTDEEPHFARIDAIELFNGVQQNIDGQVLFLENYGAITKSTNNQNPIKEIEGGFSIVKKIDGVNKYTEQLAAQAWAEGEVDKVIAKMVHDSKIPMSFMMNFKINNLMTETLSNKPIGYYGFRAEFNLDLNVSFCYDENNFQANIPLGIGTMKIGSTFIIK